MSEITLDTVIGRRGGLDDQGIDDDFVIGRPDAGEYYGLEAVGGRIWEIIAVPKAIRQIRDDLLMEYSVDRLTCERDVLEFARDLLCHGLIEVVPRH